MALLPSAREHDFQGQKGDVVPPLFASLFREDAGSRLERLEVERSIGAALSCLEEDCYAGALGKFREAWTLSAPRRELRETVQEAAVEAAGELLDSNWRVAEALLQEVDGGSDDLWAAIASRKRADAIRFALDEASRLDGSQYLPHAKNRLSAAANAYPEDSRLRERLEALDRLLSQRLADEREKNLGRLALFSERLDHNGNADTWRRFPELVAPFVSAYDGDADFGAVLDQVSELLLAWENAEALLEEGRTRDCLKICRDVLGNRPANILFRRLEEKAKGREWIALLAESTAQRARAFEAAAQYGEALEEWESLRAIEPLYPGLESEILNCAALRERAGDPPAAPRVDEPAAESEDVFVAESSGQSPEIEPARAFPMASSSKSRPSGIRIAMTEEAWNHFKTGLAATGALLLVVLVLASHAWR